MKKLDVIMMIGFLCISLFGLSGCRKYPEELSFFNFPQYNDLNTEIVSIKVDWDNNDGNHIVFDITDESAIEGIVNKLMYETKFIKAGIYMDNGGHGSITLKHKNGSETKIPLSQIQYGDKKQFYNYETDDIYNLIKQIGQSLGKLA